MHKRSYTKRSTRIFALTMCIILLFNFYTVFADGQISGNIKIVNEGWTGLFGGHDLIVNPEGNGVFTVTNVEGIGEEGWWVTFRLKDGVESGAYQIAVYYKGYNQTVYHQYKICRENIARGDHNKNNTDRINSVPLCAYNTDANHIGGLPPVETITKDKNTTVNVILEKGYIYAINFDVNDKVLMKNRPITLKIENAAPPPGGAEYFYTNIPSSYITMREALEIDHGKVAPTDSKFRTVLLDQTVIDSYLRMWGFKRVSNDVESALPVESAITGLIIFFGEILLFFAEKFLNIENLTMDKLIFNQLRRRC